MAPSSSRLERRGEPLGILEQDGAELAGGVEGRRASRKRRRTLGLAVGEGGEA